MSSYSQWSVGSIYYASLVLAEAFGKTNTSRIVDLWGNSGSLVTPQYAIYEKDILNKVALFNYMDDPTGASDLRVTLNVPTGVPGIIKVKYLDAKSVSSRENISWAGQVKTNIIASLIPFLTEFCQQTFGNHYEVDGRFRGDLNVTTINCDIPTNTCIVPVKAPGFALVFFDTTTPELGIGQAIQTFTTTLITKTRNTLGQMDPTALAQSNGDRGVGLRLGSTSQGSVSAGQRLAVGGSGLAVSVAMFVGGFWIARALR